MQNKMRRVHRGPRGGLFYLTKSGRKVYVRKRKQKKKKTEAYPASLAGGRHELPLGPFPKQKRT